jgi:excisionase family DNA binding protein
MWQPTDNKSDDKKFLELQEKLQQLEKRLNQLMAKVTNEVRDDDRYLDVATACRVLECGRTLIYELMNKGEIAYTQVGRQRRILLSDIRKYGKKNYCPTKPSIL